MLNNDLLNNDFVSRQWLIDEYHRRHKGTPGGALKMIEEAPAADVEPVKHGRWEKAQSRGCVSYADGYAECSECHGKPTFMGWDMKYCPNCGAKMDAEPSKGADDEVH